METTLIQWSDALVTGVEEIDAQHKTLLSLINDLYAAMKTGKGKKVVEKIVNELVKYAEYHFNAEEGLMKKCKVPGLSAHVKEHELFKSKVNAFLNQKANGKANGSDLLSVKVAIFLKDWLVTHVLTTDKRSFQLLQRKKDCLELYVKDKSLRYR